MGMQDGAEERREEAAAARRRERTARDESPLASQRAALSVLLAESRPSPWTASPWRPTLLLVAVEVVMGFLRF